MSENAIVIERRFCGPPNSANGGYAAGRLAAFVGGSAEVTLHRPPPLDRELRVERSQRDRVELRDGDLLLASASSATAQIEYIEAPEFPQAAEAAGRTFEAAVHTLPTCFVCGPLRDHHDGLRIHVGPVDADDIGWNGVLAAPWVPTENLGDADGKVRSEFLWAALDCPTGYACGDRSGLKSVLLGRQTVHIARRPETGEHCVVASILRGRERRKHFADAMLFAAGREVLASCRATWIEVTAAVQQGVG